MTTTRRKAVSPTKLRDATLSSLHDVGAREEAYRTIKDYHLARARCPTEGAVFAARTFLKMLACAQVALDRGLISPSYPGELAEMQEAVSRLLLPFVYDEHDWREHRRLVLSSPEQERVVFLLFLLHGEAQGHTGGGEEAPS